MRTNWQSRPRPLPSTRPLHVRPLPRPFTPHPEPEVVDVSSGDSTSGDREMEEMPHGNTVPNTPECPTTPLEQMEEDNMQRLHPTFSSNTDLIAAGDSGIELTEEQHRILMSQSEGTVKSELRYPIIQAIRSQWELQDFPKWAISTMWRMT